MGVEFKEGAVCFSMGKQRKFINHKCLYLSDNCGWLPSSVTIHESVKHSDFQLNTIKQGDYIEASELDTEQGYNDAVDVFGLFGHEWDCSAYTNFEGFKFPLILRIGTFGITQSKPNAKGILRKLTYLQLMAIGELRRLELKRDNEPQLGKNEDGSMKLIKSNFSEKPNGCKDGGKYHREIIGLDGAKTTVDVYRILDAFKTECAATDHAIKKMLCAGLRGHKDKLTDYDNAIESLQAAKELLIQKGDV